jgi:serine/threonine protein kinase
MQSPSQQISTCPNCGGVLEETPGGGLGCISCLLRAGIGGEEEVAQDSTPSAFEDGVRFGVYEIDCHADGSLCELGRGAMGVTYRATDTSLQRKVALKIIKTDIAERSADTRERFMREARAAAALRHENIATIHQFGMRLETGQYFYAMELIEGETLDDRVRRVGPLDARTAIKIAQQVTSALAAAEKCGLVHRDLKPANLMLVFPDGERAHATNNTKSLVKIIDFGLATAIHTQTDPKSLTHERFVGTPAFASPEQFTNAPVDVRSDIYSLGATLWFSLTGQMPFSGRTVEEIRDARRSKPLPVEQLKAARVPRRLVALLMSMLAIEPAARPAGARELNTKLQKIRASITDRRRRIRQLPDSFETLLALGHYQYWVLRDYGLAKSTFALVSKMLPDSSEVPKALGYIARREGHWDQSVAYFEQALALDPCNLELLVEAAGTYTMLRQFPAALKLHDRTLDIIPNDPDVMSSQAGIYQAQGNLQEAAKLLSEVNAQTSFTTLTTKITQLRLERNLGEAIRLLQARQAQLRFASEIDNVVTQLHLVCTQHLNDDTAGAKVSAAQARNMLEPLCKNQPDNAPFVAMLSVPNAVLGRKGSALKEAERAIMLLPNIKDRVYGPACEENLALIQTMVGAQSRAISTLTRLLQTAYSSWFYGQLPVTPSLLRLDPIWDPLRADPAFQKLCQEKQP